MMGSSLFSSSTTPLSSLNIKEGEEDKITFSVCNQLLIGKNEVIVAVYDTNIAADIITIMRTNYC